MMAGAPSPPALGLPTPGLSLVYWRSFHWRSFPRSIWVQGPPPGQVCALRLLIAHASGSREPCSPLPPAAPSALARSSRAFGLHLCSARGGRLEGKSLCVPQDPSSPLGSRCVSVPEPLVRGAYLRHFISSKDFNKMLLKIC